MLLHSDTHQHDLIDTMFSLGLSVSYDHILFLSTSLGNVLIVQYEQENNACPSNLRYGPFTIVAADNVDHILSLLTAKGSFHGTGISLYQHPSTENET